MRTRLALSLLTLALAPAGPAMAQPADSAWLAARGFHTRGASGQAMVHRDVEGLRELRGAQVSQVIGSSHERLEVRSGIGRRTVVVLHAAEDWRRTGDDGCELALFLNGRRVQGTNARLDNIMRRSHLDALEVYDGARAPAGGADDCGVVLVWSYRLRGTVDEEFTGQLRGRVLRQPGNEPVAGVRIVLEPGGVFQQTDSSGRFDYGGLPAAIYDLTATTPSGARWATRIALRAYAIADIAIEVEGAGAGLSPAPSHASPLGPTPERAPERIVLR